MKVTGLDLPISGWFTVTVSFTSHTSNEISDTRSINVEVAEAGEQDIIFDEEETEDNQMSFNLDLDPFDV